MSPRSRPSRAPRSPSATRPRASAFTLLELLLSVSILAAVTGLIATLWSQAGAWTAESALHERVMRLPRVLELMRSQWADRRTSVGIAAGGATVIAEPNRIEFVTASPILFPDWPIARAAYVVERDDEAPSWQAGAYRLVYEETRIADVRPRTADSGDRSPAVDPSLPPEALRTHVLLRACTELSWERFGRETDAIDTERAGEAPRRAGERPVPAREGGRGVPARPLSAPGAAGSSEPDDPEQDRRAPLGWVPFVEQVRDRPGAVRLRGVFEKEEFTCVFVIGDSR